MNPDLARSLEKPSPVRSPAARPAVKTKSHAFLWLIALAALAVLGYFAWRYWSGSGGAADSADSGGRAGRGQGPIPIVGAAAVKGDIHIYLDGLGEVTPLKTVTIRTQVNGQIIHIEFQEGQSVHEGDLLAEIDPRSYAAAVEQAQGKLQSDQAFLENAKIDLERDQTAFKTGAVSDQQVATQQALVDQYEANIIGDQGQLDAAKVNLAYCRITSPITGRIGLRLVDVGNIVQTTDSSGLAVITQLQPITVVFALPEDDLPQLISTPSRGLGLPVLAYDRDEQTLLARGRVEALDNQVDPTTGTFKVKATFPNEDNALFPQQFVNAHLLAQTKHNQVLVPTAAVQHGPDTSVFVFVVKPDQTVTIVNVQEGQTEGDMESVIGVQAGEILVTDGTDKLQEGSKVVVTLAQPTGATTRPGGRGHGGRAMSQTRPTTQDQMGQDQ